MTEVSETWFALIRAIGPATHKKMSMADLRAACTSVGLESVRTLLATGNVLFKSGKKESEIKVLLDGVMKTHELDNDVFLRRPRELKSVLARNPFPAQAKQRPNHLLVLFMENDIAEATAEILADWPGPESIHISGREVYIDYIDGIARSKLTPAVIERRFDQPGTARNWNTVGKLIDAADGL